MTPHNPRFSPSFVEALLLKPLMYFFANYAGPDLVYDEDEKLSMIDIGPINDFYKKAIQQKPRVIVDRGPFQIQGSGLSDNLAEGQSPYASMGLKNQKNLVFINGQAKIIVEARQLGACELVTDMVTHFYIWSRPYICDSQGIKNFGIPMNVSSCMADKDDTEIFRVTIDIPYIFEEAWQVNDDAVKLKNFYMNLTVST